CSSPRSRIIRPRLSATWQESSVLPYSRLSAHWKFSSKYGFSSFAVGRAAPKSETPRTSMPSTVVLRVIERRTHSGCKLCSLARDGGSVVPVCASSTFWRCEMAAVKAVPEGYHSVTPYLYVRGAAGAIDFYKKVFGATEKFRMPHPDGKIAHAELQIGDSVVMLADETPGAKSPETLRGTSGSLLLYLENVD